MEALLTGGYKVQILVLSGPTTFYYFYSTMGFLKAKYPYGFVGFVKALNFLKVRLHNLSTTTTKPPRSIASLSVMGMNSELCGATFYYFYY